MTKSSFGRDELDFGRPGALGLVVRINPTNGERSFDKLTWGLVPHNTTHLASALRPIWGRAEGLTEHAMFVDAFRRRRAIVPADEYFQTSMTHAGRQFSVRRRDGRPMAWAGLWEGYRAPNGDIIRSYCVITIDANEDVAPIHGRMPLVLEETDLPVWLGEEPGDPVSLLRTPMEGILDCEQMRRRRT